MLRLEVIWKSLLSQFITVIVSSILQVNLIFHFSTSILIDSSETLQFRFFFLQRIRFYRVVNKDFQSQRYDRKRETETQWETEEINNNEGIRKIWLETETDKKTNKEQRERDKDLASLFISHKNQLFCFFFG